MDFTKNELDMVYQYAAGTKVETLAGLKEIIPVIHDRQTKEIVENTIRKLEAIPEPECRHFIAATKQHFIEQRDNSIRRRLAETKAQSKAKKTAKDKSSQAGNGHNCFQSGKPGLPPLKEGATIHHLESGALRSAEGFLRKADDFRYAPIITGDATLPLRWLPPATLL